MSDVFLFFIGCFVSLIVLGATGLLLWGAANEQRLSEGKPLGIFGADNSAQPSARDQSVPAPAPVRQR